MKDLALEKLYSSLDLLSKVEFGAAEYLSLSGVIIAFLGLAFAIQWRKNDKRTKLIDEIDSTWASLVDVSYRLRMDCRTLQQKFEYSEISQLDMQSSIKECDSLIFKGLYETAKQLHEAFQSESSQMNLDQLYEAKRLAVSYKIQVENGAKNFNDRLTLAYEQFEQQLELLRKSC